MTNTSYLSKEMELVNAMKADDFELFDGSADEAYDTLEHIFDSFVTYANTVIRMTVMVPIWRNRFDGEDLRDKISSIDATRRSNHEAAISSIAMLNRLMKAHGLNPFADIDVTDRYQVADFVGSFVSEIYENGKSRSMDDLVASNSQEFDVHKISEDLHNF